MVQWCSSGFLGLLSSPQCAAFSFLALLKMPVEAVLADVGRRETQSLERRHINKWKKAKAQKWSKEMQNNYSSWLVRHMGPESGSEMEQTSYCEEFHTKLRRPRFLAKPAWSCIMYRVWSVKLSHLRKGVWWALTGRGHECWQISSNEQSLKQRILTLPKGQ